MTSHIFECPLLTIANVMNCNEAYLYYRNSSLCRCLWLLKFGNNILHTEQIFIKNVFSLNIMCRNCWCDESLKVRLHIPFTHAFSAMHCGFFIVYLGLLISMDKKVITSKTQCNVENTCGNRKWQLGLTPSCVV